MKVRAAAVAALNVLNHRELSKLSAELLSKDVAKAVGQRKDVTTDSELAEIERLIAPEEEHLKVLDKQLNDILNYTDGKTAIEK